MYASSVDDQKLTFFVSGQLWGRSLVMEDQETNSLWSHILGKSMAGPLQGKPLKIIPAKMTTWQAWLHEHPQTTVTMLQPTARMFTKDMLHRTEEFCMGLVRNGKSRHWRFDRLEKVSVVNDNLDALALVVHYDQDTASASVWERRIDQGLLTFEKTPSAIQDDLTQSTWDLTRGLATSGPLKGTRLKPTSAIVSFCHAWLRFHPDTTRWEPIQ